MKFIIKGGYSGTSLDRIKFPITVEGKVTDFQHLIDVKGSELIHHGALAEEQDSVEGFDPDFDYCFELGSEIEYAQPESASQKLTKEQALIIMGYTGIATILFSEFHKDVTERLGREIWTHEFANKETVEEVKALYKDDFLAMLPDY